MNDNPVILPKLTPAELGNPDVIKVLEAALAQAKAGKVAGVAVVMSMGPDALSMSSAGAFPSTIVAGCQQMSRQLLDNMFAQKRSSLLMPQRRM